MLLNLYVVEKKIFRILIFIGSVTLFVIFYRIIVKNISLTERVLDLLLVFAFVLLFFVFKSEILNEIKNVSFDRFTSFFSLLIALLAFFYTSIQTEKNNIQFEENRKASDSLFEVQLINAKQLNELLISNAEKLSSSQIVELNKIQSINTNLTISAKNQLETTKENLKLTEQSLDDYIIETRPNIIMGKTKVSDIDSILKEDSRVLKNKTIIENFSNNGKRIADNFELRRAVFYDNKIQFFSTSTTIKKVLPNESKFSSMVINLENIYSEDFYYWYQIRYYDERLNSWEDRSRYFHYNRRANGLDFYDLDEKRILGLRKFIDEKLEELNLSLTID